MQLQSTKCLVGNSIVDGLKSRLMQYLAITLTAPGVESPIITEIDKILLFRVLPKEGQTHVEVMYIDLVTHVTHRSQNIENTWALLSFKVDMTFTLNDIDLQMTLTFK